MQQRKLDKISTYFLNHIYICISILITGLTFNGLMSLVPIIQGKLIDAFFLRDSLELILKLSVTFISFVIFVQINRFFKRYFVRLLANKIIITMRSQSMKNLMNMDINNINAENKGDIMNKNLGDIADTAEGIRKVTTEIFDTIVLMLSYSISMLIMDLKTTIIVFIFIALAIFSSSILKKIIYKATLDYKKEFGNNKLKTLTMIKNELYYRSLGASENYQNNYENNLNNLRKKSIKAMVFQGSMEPIYNIIAMIGVIFVIYLTGQKVINGVWQIGTFSAYLTTFILVANKASKTGKVFNAYQKAKVSWERCKPFLKQIDMKEKYNISGNLKLELNNVNFGFNDNCILKNLNYCFEEGEIIGISGKVHMGKSTFASLLTGLYDYTGNIYVNGVELKNIQKNETENLIGYAPSNIDIFNSSIKENISLGKNGDYVQAAIDSQLSVDIENFPQKYNQIISHSTANLSGGQQKRLAIARAIFNYPKIIILDDPFNSIDSLMAKKIFKNLKTNYKNCLIFIVCNQKDILELTDKVIYFEKNKHCLENYKLLINKCNSFKLLMQGVNE